MFITYINYKGGINNLIVCHYDFNSKIKGTSLISKEYAIKNMKRNFKKIKGFSYLEENKEDTKCYQ